MYIYIYRLYKILFDVEAFVHESILLFANSPFVWASPSPPFIAHTIAQYIIPTRPPFFAIYAYTIGNDNLV